MQAVVQVQYVLQMAAGCGKLMRDPISQHCEDIACCANIACCTFRISSVSIARISHAAEFSRAILCDDGVTDVKFNMKWLGPCHRSTDGVTELSLGGYEELLKMCDDSIEPGHHLL